MKSKKLTENDCLRELERVCRIVVYQKVEGGGELEFFRKTLQSALEKLAEIRKRKADEAAARAAAKAKAEAERLFGKK